jgi:hypothetical protein
MTNEPILSAENDPVEHMLAHALHLIGDDPKRAAQAKQFAKELGPVMRQLWESSFLNDDEYWGDALPQHLENIEKAKVERSGPPQGQGR